MNLKKILGYGLALWILMFVIVSVFIAFNFYPGGISEISIAAIAGIVSYFLAGFAKPEDYADALKLGLGWVVVGLILDWLVSTRFNPAIFEAWTLWFGYALAALAPLLKVKKV